MTSRERKLFDALQRKLNETPVNRISFFAGVTEEHTTANTPYENWKQQSECENRAICKHLGIEYRNEDFTISEEELARQWANSLEDID